MADDKPNEKPRRVGVVHHRSDRMQRVNAWRKRSPLSPYWLDWSHLLRSVEGLVPFARGVMLDVGVSEAPYRELFEPQVERYVGLEYPPSIIDKQPALWSMLDTARETIEVFGDGMRLPFQDGVFDTVVCTEVLEHLPDPEAAVAAMARVLRTGGRLLVTVPFIQPLHELPSDYYRFTPSSLEHLVTGAGLELERIEPRGNFASALGAMLSQFLLRSLGATRLQSDGSVILSRWRSTLLLPFLAAIQVGFHLASKLTRDTTVCQGHSVVARKPAPAGAQPAAPREAHTPVVTEASF